MSGEGNARRKGGREVQLPRVPPGAEEVASKRGRHAAAFRSGGRVIHCCSGQPLHYLKGGQYEEYDLRIRPDPGKLDYPHVMDGAEYTARFGLRYGDAKLLRLEAGGSFLELSPTSLVRREPGKEWINIGIQEPVLGVSTAFNAKGLTQQGRRAWPNCLGAGYTLTVTPLEQRLDKQLTLPRAPAAMPQAHHAVVEWRWQFATDSKLKVDGIPWIGEAMEGERVESDAGWFWPAPVVHDAKGALQRGWYRLEHNAGRDYVTMVWPLDWFHEPEREAPFILDPQTTYESESNDGYIQGEHAVYATARSTSTYETFTSSWPQVGQEVPANYKIKRFFCQFDTSNITQERIVTELTLTLTVAINTSDTNFDIEIAKCPWTPGGNRETNYDAALAATLDAVLRNTSGIATSTPYTSPPLDVSWLNRGAGAVTEYAVRSDRDYNADVPAGDEYIALVPQEGITQSERPLLTVTTIDPARPTAHVEQDSTGTLVRYLINWEADGAGDVDLRLDGNTGPALVGRPVRLVTWPASGAAPTDNYDITLEDEQGNDILHGAGIDRDTADTEQAWVSETASAEVPLRPHSIGPLHFRVTNAGQGNSGLAVIYCSIPSVDWF